eukprot:Polyplicarium_translucidae@DN2595_c0_g1_i4.p2
MQTPVQDTSPPHSSAEAKRTDRPEQPSVKKKGLHAPGPEPPLKRPRKRSSSAAAVGKGPSRPGSGSSEENCKVRGYEGDVEGCTDSMTICPSSSDAPSARGRDGVASHAGRRALEATGGGVRASSADGRLHGESAERAASSSRPRRRRGAPRPARRVERLPPGPHEGSGADADVSTVEG